MAAPVRDEKGRYLKGHTDGVGRKLKPQEAGIRAVRKANKLATKTIYKAQQLLDDAIENGDWEAIALVLNKSIPNAKPKTKAENINDCLSAMDKLASLKERGVYTQEQILRMADKLMDETL